MQALLLLALIAAPEWKVRRAPLETSVRGLSGLARDPQGRTWTVAERERVLLRLRLDGAKPAVDGPPVPLDGVPSGADTESLAFLGPGLVALGTEDLETRKSEVILTATVSARARVIDALSVPLKPWKLKGEPNRGVEGVCAAGDHMLAAFETTWERKDRRFAAIAARTRDGPWVALRLVLTSEQGKISGLACRALGPTTLEVLAIERHYETSRLLRFLVTLDGQKHTLEPEPIADLAALLGAPVPNLEGVEWLDEKRDDVLLISDDSHLSRPGTELIFLSR